MKNTIDTKRIDVGSEDLLNLVTGGVRHFLTPEEKRELNRRVKEQEELEELARKALNDILGANDNMLLYKD